MSARLPGSVVSTGWLAGALGAADLRVIDASWHLPAEHRDPRADYAAGHIPGAAHIELGDLAARLDELPNEPLAAMCGHGERAMTAASVMERAGRRDLIAVAGVGMLKAFTASLSSAGLKSSTLSKNALVLIGGTAPKSRIASWKLRSKRPWRLFRLIFGFISHVA